MRWIDLSASEADRREAARGIVEVLSGLPQPSPDRMSVLASGAGQPAEQRATTVQSPEPISYRELAKRFVGLQWSSLDPEHIAALIDDGSVVSGKSGVRHGRGRTLDRMDVEGPQRRRAPMVINRRPGRGGHNRQAAAGRAIDPTEGLDAYGEITWRPVSGGARVGVLWLGESGNTVLAHRLSIEDRKERFTAQVEPNMALARRHPDELQVRALLFAENMSGTREVRGDREPALPRNIDGRDDLHLIDEWIEDWCEHVVWRDGDRIARDVIPGETIIRRWRRHGVGLWLSSYGRKMDYVTDRLALRATTMVSAEERDNATRRMQLAQINKGPMQGRGWLGNTPFGLVRDPHTGELHEDLVQWKFILRAFELADSGIYIEDGALSTRAIAEQLAAEGCPFDHDRVRVILKTPLYATGEFVTKVRGIPVAQGPVQLANPVPLDRFQNVQNLLALRQGRTNRTPLGEFILNYVDCVHVTCMNYRHPERGWRPQISGVILSSQRPETRNYRHSRVVCEECKRMRLAWPRETLERPIIEEVRQIAAHPELLLQAAALTEHDVARASARLSPAEREGLEREIAALKHQRDSVTEEYVADVGSGVGSGASADVEVYRKLVSGFTKRIDRLQTRLTNDAVLADLEVETVAEEAPTRLRDFLEILTVEVPQNPAMKALRARLFQRVVSRVEIDADETGIHGITLYGHLVPEGADVDMTGPVVASADLLDLYAQNRERVQAGDLSEASDEIVSDLSASTDKSVTILRERYADLPTMPSTEKASRQASYRLDAWHWQYGRRASGGSPGWRLDLGSVERSAPPRRPRMGRTRETAARQTAVLGFINEGGPVRSAHVAQLFGISSKAARDLLRTMVSDGLIRFEGAPRNGSYRVAASDCASTTAVSR